VSTDAVKGAVWLWLATGSAENPHGLDGGIGVRRVEVIRDSKFDAIVDVHASRILVRDRKAPEQIRLLRILGSETDCAGSQIRHGSGRAGQIVITR
jgi:hypothetical protein